MVCPGHRYVLDYIYICSITSTWTLHSPFQYPLAAIARVHRQISEDNTTQINPDNTTGLTAQLQVSTTQVRALPRSL